MISVVIPCYNCETTIERCIDSVLRQTYEDWELILVDNNSLDNTLRMLKSYQQQYPHKIRVCHEQKRGAPAARNRGLKEAKKAWIQFLDADDELSKFKLEHQCSLVQQEGCDIIVGKALIQKTVDNQEIVKVRPVDSNIWRGLISSKLGITSANLWRTSFLRKVNGWEESLTSSQEYDLVFRMLQRGARVFTDHKILTIIHKAGNSISQSTSKQQLTKIIKNRIDLRYRIKDYLLQRNLLNHELEETFNAYIYKELMCHVVEIPVYVKRELRRTSLKVPFRLILKFKWKAFKKHWQRWASKEKPIPAHAEVHC